jgi:hypothetical protein
MKLTPLLVLVGLSPISCTATRDAKPSVTMRADASLDVHRDARAQVSEDSGVHARDASDTFAPDAAIAIPAWPASGPPPTRIAAPARLVAIGDIHGDYDQTIAVLRIAGLIDEDLHWAGGRTLAVQVGDQLDRGAGERHILDWFEVLAVEAHAAGGGFFPLLGNHEIMNAEEDYRYVTEAGWLAFSDIPYDRTDARFSSYPEYQRPRVAAFIPGGQYAQVLARHNLTMIVGDTLFVHGGILPPHVTYGLDRMNEETQSWLRGERSSQPSFFEGDLDPVWSRHYSSDPTPEDCALARTTLENTQTTRIVVAHTVQSDGINTSCDGLVYRIDVGIARYYGGMPQALEIRGSTVTILR